MKLIVVGHQFTEAKSGISSKTGKEYNIQASIKISCLRKVSDPSVNGLTCKTLSIPASSPFYTVLFNEASANKLNGSYLDCDVESNNGFEAVSELEILETPAPFALVVNKK